MMKQKANMEGQIQDMKERLEEEENTASSLSANKRKLDGELNDLKRDLEGLESTLAKTEKEKQVNISPFHWRHKVVYDRFLHCYCESMNSMSSISACEGYDKRH